MLLDQRQQLCVSVFFVVLTELHLPLCADWVRKLILDIVTNSDDSAKHFVEELELWVKELKDKPWDEEDKKIAGQIQTHLSRNQNFREKVMIKCDLLKYLLKFVTSVPQGPIPVSSCLHCSFNIV